jgi:hypothetical protein
MYKKMRSIISSQIGSGLPVMLTAVAVVIAAAGFGVYQYNSHKVPAGHAAVGNQWCSNNDYTCLNAWNNGPAVRTYFSGQSHNDFSVVAIPNSSNFQIEYVGGATNGPYWSDCIGDAANSPTRKDASLLSSCPTRGGNAGWGTVFSIASCHTPGNNRAGYTFKNAHWSSYWGRPAYLHPNGNATSPNNAFYLDGAGAYCFGKLGPA